MSCVIKDVIIRYLGGREKANDEGAYKGHVEIHRASGTVRTRPGRSQALCRVLHSEHSQSEHPESLCTGSHCAANSGEAAEVNAIRESGVHDPVARADRT
jgi:hypothetical protein